MKQPSWPSTVVAVALIGLVGVMFWKAADSSDFATIWAGAGTVVGVVVGAVPSYFFKQQADRATRKADALVEAGGSEVVTNARAIAPNAF